MLYKLCWKNQDGEIGYIKQATTEERAKQWVKRNNELYNWINHWVEEVTFKQGTQQTGLTQ